MTNAAIQLQPAESASLARATLDPMNEWRAMRDQADTLVKSGFLPRTVDTPEKALALMQTGRELGIGPMQAIRSIHIIDGKPVIAAELMAGLVLSRIPGAMLRVAKTNETECVVVAARPGQEATEFRFTMQDAQKASLTGKQNWRNYPRAMLRNRCLAEAARAIFPDATMGLYDPDELGAVTDQSGAIVQPRPVSAAHAVMGDDAPGPSGDGPAVRDRLTTQLEKLRQEIAFCETWDRALELRRELGSRAAPKEAELTREMQRIGPDGRLISSDDYKALAKAWAHCDRQLAKKEAALKPALEASFIDEAEPTPMREPGAEG